MLSTKSILILIGSFISIFIFFVIFRNCGNESTTNVLSKWVSSRPNLASANNTFELSLADLSIDALKFLLHGIITTNRKICDNFTIHGRTNTDGGYDICLSGRFKPDPKSCKVMSFGINNEWSFDDAMGKYGCYVHSFDPSMGKEDHMHSPNIQFHNTGLGKVNEVNSKKWKMTNIKTAIADAKWANEVIDVIKCDAEGAEWAFMEDVLENLFKVKQIILEIHSPRLNPHPVTRDDISYIIKLFILLQRNGFVVDHSYHKYWCCTAFSPMFPPEITEKCCHEVYLYNTRYQN